jgi:archaellum component FlaC
MNILESMLRLDDIEKRLEELENDLQCRMQRLEDYCHTPVLVDGIAGFVAEFEEERTELWNEIKNLKVRLEIVNQKARQPNGAKL